MEISFFANFIKIMTSFHKKCWRHCKNDPTEQTSIWYRVLRVTYTNLSILNQLCQGFYGGESNESHRTYNSQKSPTLVGLNFQCLLNPVNRFAMHCKWLVSLRYEFLLKGISEYTVYCEVKIFSVLHTIHTEPAITCSKLTVITLA